MADAKQAAQQAAYEATPSPITGTPFGDMSGTEKLTFLGKALIMLCTGGFAFPNVFVE